MNSNHDFSFQELKSKKEFDLERFFSITPDILCIASPEGILKKINPSFANSLGYSIEELLDTSVSSYIHPDDRKLTSKLRHEISRNIPMINFDNRYITKGGETIWLSWTSVYEPEDELIYAVAKNVTQIKELEEKRNSLLIELTRLNTELKQFAYTTSHDLRSPIDNIISLFGLMNFPKIEDKQTLKYIEVFYTSVLNLKQTLNKHIETLNTEKKINIDLQKLNLNNTLNIVKESISESIKNSKAKLLVDFSEVPSITFSSFYLQSIFLNLLSNAIKYSDIERKPIISITSKKVNGKTQIIFADNGIGFDMDKVKGDIFKLHETFHNHSDSKGIGLFLVKSHLESLGGSIEVASKINVGTTFTLTFKE
ncbi:PAS domain-containing sensor histidine kinase [Wenyingzhuangia sp. chi5]|uniref:histidine kinase n=1 Tax=Wenyingzhuangia gilva TaxID=3057677 RepID=A0ABT8VMQ2_9FLAO|nr:PAS domain-containing sensor histidine kinase [Wenyingzhuangia sp. chi5]MDO3693249.1 PAS domain-containing sensor histidine kinase [Wenyingzhuangia sp. chi5]